MINLSGNYFWFGFVEDINDPEKIGRLRVRVVGVHSEDRTEVPTDMLPWWHVCMPLTSASISGIGSSPIGVLPGTCVAGIFVDDSKQQGLVWFSIPGKRSAYRNKSYGFNDPNNIYPVEGQSSDVNERAQGIDVQYNPMEYYPVNDQMNNDSVQVPDTSGATNEKYVTMRHFWMGRDSAYPNELTPEIINNAKTTVTKVNLLLEKYFAANPNAKPIKVNSGWRPAAVNAATPGAATRSKHMLGQAIDIGDVDGALDEWCFTAEGTTALAEIGLWMEHKSATPRWAHFQIVPPRSGNRFFRP